MAPMHSCHSCVLVPSARRFRATREARWLVAYLMFSSVGVGSFLFHMTLYYGCQAMDELPCAPKPQTLNPKPHTLNPKANPGMPQP